jgi:DNA repair photolyase
MSEELINPFIPKTVKFNKSPVIVDLRVPNNPDVVRDWATNLNSVECDFRLDYSYLQYADCHGCKFCYTVGDNQHKSKYLPSFKITGEWQHFKERLISTPITMSRWCDPFYDKDSIYHTFKVAKFILDNGGKVIFVSPSGYIPDEVFLLAKQYADKIQYQIKVFTDDSVYGTILRNRYSPKSGNLFWHKINAKKLLDHGIKVSVKIDPIIINVNIILINNIIKEFNDIGIYSFIFKMLIATQTFKEELDLISKRNSFWLSEKHGAIYWQYPSHIVFDTLAPIILQHPESTITFCNNAYMNYILNSHNNCCQFDNADIKYNIDYPIKGLLPKDIPKYVPIDTLQLPKQKKGK